VNKRIGRRSNACMEATEFLAEVSDAALYLFLSAPSATVTLNLSSGTTTSITTLSSLPLSLIEAPGAISPCASIQAESRLAPFPSSATLISGQVVQKLSASSARHTSSFITSSIRDFLTEKNLFRLTRPILMPRVWPCQMTHSKVWPGAPFEGVSGPDKLGLASEPHRVQKASAVSRLHLEQCFMGQGQSCSRQITFTVRSLYISTFVQR